METNRTLLDLFRDGAALLGGGPQALLEAKVLLLRAAALTEERYLAAPDRPCTAAAEARFRRLVTKRLGGVPLAYLTGTREFWSIPFQVTPSVLVPRPETEVLVEKVLELSRVAAANAALHRARHIRFRKSDLLSAFRGTGAKFDFIVSNPPYIARDEWDSLPAEVRDYEPRRALLAGESGLEIIERLVRRARTFLRPGGYLIFEIGEDQRDRVLALFDRRWTEIETAWDLAGKPRVITARRA